MIHCLWSAIALCLLAAENEEVEETELSGMVPMAHLDAHPLKALFIFYSDKNMHPTQNKCGEVALLIISHPNKRIISLI